MKTRFLLIGLLSLIAVACADPELEVMTDKSDPVTTQSVRQRTLEEALTSAENWFAMMDDETRGIPRRIKSVEYVSSASRTRSGDIDTLMYLVNYDDDQGFALLGRPSTSKEIYAISGEGALDMSDTVYNKPLARFMASARADANATMFTTINSTRGLTIPTNPIKLETRIIRQRKPMLDSIGKIGKWSQTYPYNQACPIINKNVGYTGCGPLAVGMLMAYYRYPYTMYSEYPKLKTTIHWNQIIEKNNTIAISTLLEALSKPHYLDSKYAICGKDTAYDDRETLVTRITPTFGGLGFGLGDAWAGHRLCVEGTVDGKDTIIDIIEPIMDFMDNGYSYAKAAPLILHGTLEQEISSDTKGHIWITDGYIQEEAYLPNNPNFVPLKKFPAFHMVWGWGGKANGYYYYFKTDQKVIAIIDPNIPDDSYTFWNVNVYGRYTIF